MEDKAELKMGVHQLLIKNGFYRLPMLSLSEILKLLEMPESFEPKNIQENTINGLIKVVQKYNNKYLDYVNLPKNTTISKETKEYVNILLEDTINLTKKNSNSTSLQVPPLISQQMAPQIPPIYPPQMNPYNMMRPPMPPFSQFPKQSLNDTEMMRMEEQVRQQMYMYYYGMYNNAGYPPMYNSPYMNPYSFGQMPAADGKSSNPQIPPPMNPFAMNPLMMNAMGYSHMNPMPGISPPPLSNPNPKTNQPSTSKSNPSLKSQIQQELDKNWGPKGSKKQMEQLNKTQRRYQQRLELKKAEKRKSQKSAEKPKLKDPPFIINEKTPIVTPVKESAKVYNELLKFCACRGMEQYEDQFLCSICNRLFHYLCLSESLKKIQTKQAIQCYHCRMRFIDPLNKVKEVIAEYYIPNISENKFWVQCNLKPYEYLCRPKGSKNEIEMRCLKVCPSDNSQITWPDQCMIKLNGERIIEIPALQINSSLKKRKDYSIIITQNIFNKANQQDPQALQKIKLSMEIRTMSKQDMNHRKIKNNYTFAFAIYFVERYTIDELYNKILTEQKIPQTPDYLQKLMRTSENDIQIDKIIVSLYDPFTWELIKIPVRGHKCQHGQCFDLRVFLSFMLTARNRTWKCPVCGKDARKFMFDSRQAQVIKKITDSNDAVPSEVSFMRDGTIVLKIDSRNEDEGPENAKQPKTKKIHKQSKEKESKSQSEMKNEKSQSRLQKMELKDKAKDKSEEESEFQLNKKAKDKKKKGSNNEDEIYQNYESNKQS